MIYPASLANPKTGNQSAPSMLGSHGQGRSQGRRDNAELRILASHLYNRRMCSFWINGCVTPGGGGEVGLDVHMVMVGRWDVRLENDPFD